MSKRIDLKCPIVNSLTLSTIFTLKDKLFLMMTTRKSKMK
jgi:hypothetical protein